MFYAIMAEMKEINYKEMKFNPFNLIGGEWMLVTAGNEQSGCNTMTASWGHLGCLWGHNDPTAVIYLRPSRYTKKFVDEEPYFTLCVMDKSFKKQMAYLGSVSGRDEDKIAKTGLTPVYADNSVYFQEAKLVIKVDGEYKPALEAVGTQGVAPDAQLVVMKVFGKGGGAYDSDYMVADRKSVV